jgi:hypothetical protein
VVTEKKMTNEELLKTFESECEIFPDGNRAYKDHYRAEIIRLMKLGAAVSASPQPDLHVDLDYVFDALIATSEALGCSCKPGSGDGPCSSCQANHASAIIDKLRKSFFAPAPAQESPRPEWFNFIRVRQRTNLSTRQTDFVASFGPRNILTPEADAEKMECKLENVKEWLWLFMNKQQ